MEINSDKQILLTEIFDDFTFDKSIEMLCNEINSIISASVFEYSSYGIGVQRVSSVSVSLNFWQSLSRLT